MASASMRDCRTSKCWPCIPYLKPTTKVSFIIGNQLAQAAIVLLNPRERSCYLLCQFSEWNKVCGTAVAAAGADSPSLGSFAAWARVLEEAMVEINWACLEDCRCATDRGRTMVVWWFGDSWLELCLSRLRHQHFTSRNTTSTSTSLSTLRLDTK